MSAPDQSHFYEPLRFKSAIRLLRRIPGINNDEQPCFVLEQYSLDDHPSYIAISYTWDAPYFSEPGEDESIADASFSALLQISGSTFYATRNMLDAVRCASDNSDVQHIWVDAACINQSSHCERSIQVKQMNRIYNQAEEVICWLGGEHVYAQSFQWMSNRFAFVIENAVALNGKEVVFSAAPHTIASYMGCDFDEFSRLEEEAHRFFNSCRWFERCWVVQETYLARRVRMFCGSVSINPKGLALLQMAYTHTSWNTHRQNSLEPHPSSRALGFASFGRWISLAQILQDRGAQGASEDFRQTDLEPRYKLRESCESTIWLWNTVKALQPSTCSDPRDKVYAALSLAEFTGPVSAAPEGVITPDYTSSVKEVYTSFCKKMMRDTGSLSILAEIGEHEYRQIDGLPSWVEDFSGKYTVPITYFFIHSPYIKLVDALGLRKCLRFSATTMSAFGGKFATVTARSKTRIDDRSDEVLSLIELIAEAPDQLDGVPKVEALWRTLINDATIEATGTDVEGRSKIMTPAPDRTASQFNGFMIYHLMTWLLSQIDTGVATSEAVQRLNKALSRLTTRSFDGSICFQMANVLTCAARMAMDFPAEVRNRCEELFYNVQKFKPHLFWTDENGKLQSHPGIDADLGKIGLQHMGFQSVRVANGAAERPCFLTQEGFIGNGPRALREGDQIWFIQSCLMPVALRPISQGVFRLVGGVYLHGFMRSGRMFEQRYGLTSRWGRFILA